MTRQIAAIPHLDHDARIRTRFAHEATPGPARWNVPSFPAGGTVCTSSDRAVASALQSVGGGAPP